jgi:hypothetical protein
MDEEDQERSVMDEDPIEEPDDLSYPRVLESSSWGSHDCGACEVCARKGWDWWTRP